MDTIKTLVLKFSNDWSMNLAGMIAYSLITALFPILLAILSLVGMVLQVFASADLIDVAYGGGTRSLRPYRASCSSDLPNASDLVSGRRNPARPGGEKPTPAKLVGAGRGDARRCGDRGLGDPPGT